MAPLIMVEEHADILRGKLADASIYVRKEEVSLQPKIHVIQQYWSLADLKVLTDFAAEHGYSVELGQPVGLTDITLVP